MTFYSLIWQCHARNYSKLEIVILTHGASSHQVDHEDSPALSGEQSCMDHLYWNTIHLERDSESKPAFNQTLQDSHLTDKNTSFSGLPEC